MDDLYTPFQMVIFHSHVRGYLPTFAVPLRGTGNPQWHRQSWQWTIRFRMVGSGYLPINQGGCCRCTDWFSPSWGFRIQRVPPFFGLGRCKETGAHHLFCWQPVERFWRGVAALHAWRPWPTTRPRILRGAHGLQFQFQEVWVCLKIVYP